MEKADIIILEEDKLLVNAIKAKFDIYCDLNIKLEDKNFDTVNYDLNSTLFVTYDKEKLLDQLSQNCDRNQFAVYERNCNFKDYETVLFCLGKIFAFGNFVKKLTNSPLSKEYLIDCLIDRVFSTLNIRRNLLGAHYLNHAIKLVVNNPFLIMHGITTQLYPSIANKYSTTPSRVERSIRHTLENCYCSGKFTTLNDLFKSNIYTSRDKPSNGEFIALIADKINLKLQDNHNFQI